VKQNGDLEKTGNKLTSSEDIREARFTMDSYAHTYKEKRGYIRVGNGIYVTIAAIH
jgi:hypothetical protein